MYHIARTNEKIQERIQNTLPARKRGSRIGNTPKLQDLGSTIVMSMDVSALYPSITRDLAERTIIKMVKQSKLRWEDIDTVTLGRYLALTWNAGELKKHRIDKCEA